MDKQRMRIIAGTWKGRVIAAPKGRGTRPTSDRVREGIFSAVFSAIGELDGLHVADFYAGSGALGLEALSRGAASAVFVECDAMALAALRANLAALGAGAGQARIVGRNVARIAAARDVPEPCSLLFLDPPYRIDALEVAQVLTDLASAGALCEGALIVYEHATGASAAWPPAFTRTAEKRYGETTVSFATYEG